MVDTGITQDKRRQTIADLLYNNTGFFWNKPTGTNTYFATDRLDAKVADIIADGIRRAAMQAGFNAATLAAQIQQQNHPGHKSIVTISGDMVSSGGFNTVIEMLDKNAIYNSLVNLSHDAEWLGPLMQAQRRKHDLAQSGERER